MCLSLFRSPGTTASPDLAAEERLRDLYADHVSKIPWLKELHTPIIRSAFGLLEGGHRHEKGAPMNAFPQVPDLMDAVDYVARMQGAGKPALPAPGPSTDERERAKEAYQKAVEAHPWVEQWRKVHQKNPRSLRLHGWPESLPDLTA